MRFVEKYLFLTTPMLGLSRETPLAPEAGCERHLVLGADKAPEPYAHCVFIGALTACCGLSSPARRPDGVRPAAMGALPRSGYDRVAEEPAPGKSR